MNRITRTLTLLGAGLTLVACAEAMDAPEETAAVAQTETAVVAPEAPALLVDVTRQAQTVAFGTIGLDVEASDEGFAVTGVSDDAPAAAAGIRPGMMVTAVDGMPTIDMDVPTFERLVRGEPGAEVEVSVVDADGAEQIVVLDRVPVVETVTYCERVQELRQQTEFGGVGLRLRTDCEGVTRIVDVFDGMPAAEAGVRAGDVIVGIDGMSLDGANQWDVVGSIRGDVGAAVALDVQSDNGEVRTVQLERVAMAAPAASSCR